VNPAGSSGYAWFQYGTDSTFTSFTSTQAQAVTANQTTQSFSATITSLTSNTTYYFRIAFYNSGNGSYQYGNILTFNTH
jgi:phosphodiesterase/alkaline phosphatase D-like protein